MTDNKNALIELFYIHGKEIKGVYDLILRGSASSCTHVKTFVKDWSDLDFSIIVEKIDQEVLDQIQNLYNILKQHTDMKITITLVDQEEFTEEYHFHGIRPLTYRFAVGNSESLLIKDITYAKRDFKDNIGYRLSSYFYLSYLIHDLRNRYTMCGNDLAEVRDFFRHLIKRSNHILWNAIFLKVGYIGEDTNEDYLYENYPMLDKEFVSKLKYSRENWTRVREDVGNMHLLISYVFENLDKIYKEINRHSNQLLSTLQPFTN